MIDEAMGRMDEAPGDEREQAPEQPQDENMLKIMLGAMKILYDPKTSPGIVKMLQAWQPAQALMQAAIFVLRILFNESKGKAPPEAMMGAVEKVVSLLAELADAAGVQIDPQTVAQVTEQVRQTIGQKMQGGQSAKPPVQQPAPQQSVGQPMPQGGMIAGAMA